MKNVFMLMIVFCLFTSASILGHYVYGEYLKDVEVTITRPIATQEVAPVLLIHNDGTSFVADLYVRKANTEYLLSEGTWGIMVDPDWKKDVSNRTQVAPGDGRNGR